YLPYRPKRKTRATVAIEKGLEPLAEMIFTGRETDPERRALSFLNDQVKDIESALQGARDIIAEWINENGEARNRIRSAFEKTATITSKVKKKKEAEADKYRDYFDFSESLHRIPSHRLLAIRRGEQEGYLTVSISPDEDRALDSLKRLFQIGRASCRERVEVSVVGR